MRRFLLPILLAAAFLMAGCSAEATSALPDLQGRYRVVAVFAPDSAQAQRGENALKSTPGLKERDIAWFVVGPNEVVSNIQDKPSREDLEKIHDVDAFEVVLVGKDGSVKATQLGGMNLQEIFDTIDNMPMRQQEMTHSQ